jgi:hypothetical protein
LDRIPKRSTVIPTNSRHRSWTENSFGSAFNRAKIDASMEDRDLHCHDLRGTAATRFYIAGPSVRVSAHIMDGRRSSSLRMKLNEPLAADVR